MDYWDPLLLNTLALSRELILWDSTGIGQSTGTVPSTIVGMASAAITILAALPLTGPIDLLGFSMGGLIAPLVYLNAPPTLKPRLHKLVLAGTALSAGEGVVANGPERAVATMSCASKPQPDFDNCFSTIFFGPSEASQRAGRAWWERVHEWGPSTAGGEERSRFVSWGFEDAGVGLKAMAAALAAFGDPEKKEEGFV